MLKTVLGKTVLGGKDFLDTGPDSFPRLFSPVSGTFQFETF